MRAWLASNSSRRKEMLEPIIPTIFSKGVDADESIPKGMPILKAIDEICRRKAEAAKSKDYEFIIVSDTMIVDPDDETKAIGKPDSIHHARMILEHLRGRKHTVVTSSGLFIDGNWEFSQSTAEVLISNYSNQELEELLISKSWLGKAGGYDLAGEMKKFANLIKGEEATVLGLTPKVIQDSKLHSSRLI
ncbi:MAG: hypothetical protein CMB73_06680 [Euryarchaeota archaeon]|nr:hypothetical protein [Euryarchaeota archaeon]